MVTVWWSAIGVIHYSFLGVNETINAKRYCNDLAVMHARLSEKRPALVNRRGPILLHDNARPHVARMTVQKLTELEYETLPQPPYSPDLSPTDYHLFKHLNTFLDGKTFRSKQEVETTIKDFVASQPLTFYQQGINNLVVRWQRCIAAQGYNGLKYSKVVSSAIVDKYIGESARLIREMFNYARDHQPCIIFMDEIDAIGGRRFSEGTSADREIQRTLMELLNQMDGFDSLGQVKMIMATNRPDTLDPALLRPGRLDRKIEIALPNEQARLEILKIHSGPITKRGEIDFEAVVKLSDNFNGADLRNVCTEAGLFAIRNERDYVIEEDFMKAVRKVADNKKLETKLDYKPV
ncbi:Transposase type 1 [Trinorchestia longiramus]|nr:Transposase type 1 [Trinorchestia longiramus]